jgi:enamine deaminase RidA (YjgF/YER057c/UK114 family)
MSRRIATLSTTTSEHQDGLIRASSPPADVPRIYHYPTKFRKQVPRIQTLQTYARYDAPDVAQATSDGYVGRTEFLAANPSSPKHALSDEGGGSKLKNFVSYFQRPELRTPKLSPSFWNIPALKNFKPSSRYLLILLLPLLWLALSHLLSPATPSPVIPQDHKMDEMIKNQVMDPEELKSYIRKLVKYYSQEDKSTLQELQKRLSENTQTLQGEVQTIKKSLTQLGSDQKEMKISGESRQQAVQDALQNLETRIRELQTQQVTIAEVRRVVEQATSGNKHVTQEELEKLKDEVFSKMSSLTSNTNGDAPAVPSSYDISQEIQKQVRPSIAEIRESMKAFEQDISQEVQKQVRGIPQEVQKQLQEYDISQEVQKQVNGYNIPQEVQKQVHGYDIPQEVQKQVRAVAAELSDSLRPSENDISKEVQKQLLVSAADLRGSVKASEHDISKEVQKQVLESRNELKESLEAELRNKLREEEAKVAEIIKAQESKVREEFAEKLESKEEKVKGELEAMLKKEEQKNNAEIEALTQQLKVLRDQLQERPAPAATTADEISPKLHSLVKELVKENTPVPQIKESPIDGNLINGLIASAVEQLTSKLDTVSSRVDGLATNVASAAKQDFSNEKAQIEAAISEIDRVVSEKIRELPVDSLTAAQLDSLKSQILVETLAKVMSEVKKMLVRYNADKNERVDWALGTLGAQIVPSRTSETYTPIPANPTIFQQVSSYVVGYPHGFGPTAILNTDVTTGHCWAFKGDKGHVTVKLPARQKPIYITHVSLDHISSSIAPNIKSAPKDCIIWGMADESAPRVELGKLTFDVNSSDFVQTFDLENPGVYPVVMLEVLSNYGLEEYTCIYRFRIHGDEI